MWVNKFIFVLQKKKKKKKNRGWGKQNYKVTTKSWMLKKKVEFFIFYVDLIRVFYIIQKKKRKILNLFQVFDFQGREEQYIYF